LPTTLFAKIELLLSSSLLYAGLERLSALNDVKKEEDYLKATLLKAASSLSGAFLDGRGENI